MDLETNTRARRVEPVVLEWWAVVSQEGKIDERTISNNIFDVELWHRSLQLINSEVRKVKLTIEVA